MAAVPLLLSLTSACLQQPGTPRTGGEPASRGPGASGAPEAVSVRVVVSGGIAGMHEVHTVSRDDAGGAASPREGRILALAADPAVRGLASERARGPGPCCDLRRFEIAVRFADGTRTRIETSETHTGPPELRRLLRLMSATG